MGDSGLPPCSGCWNYWQYNHIKATHSWQQHG
jgi:hypothetical protein